MIFVADKVRTAVIGCGEWGKNHVRNLKNLENSELVKVSDLKKELLDRATTTYNVPGTQNFGEILKDESIEAVTICTPASTHYDLTKKFLEAGKHVLVEKPLAMTSKQAQELVDLAKKKSRVLMVGHVFRFDPGVNKVREMIRDGTFGKVYYVSQSRTGLKNPREDCGVIFNYAVHDFDIMSFILGDCYPEEVTAITAHSLRRQQFEDVAVVAARFKDDVLGYSQVSWLPPMKGREFLVVGEKKSASIDTMNFKMDVFDCGITPNYDSFGDFRLITRQGAMATITFEKQEPLGLELKHFLECVRTGKTPVANGEVGVRILKILEACMKSEKQKCTVKLDENGNTI